MDRCSFQKHCDFFPHAAAAGYLSFPPSLAGAARAKNENRSHPSLQDVINLPSWRLFLAAFGSRAWDFLALFTGCLSCGAGLQAAVPAGRAGMGADAQEKAGEGGS